MVSRWGCGHVRLLIVEDEPLIAADLEMIITDTGHEVVGVADSKASAFRLIAEQHLDGAFVDIGLRDGYTGIEVAEHLSGEKGVPVFFLTGNAELVTGGPHGAVAILHKPFSEDHIRHALAALMRRQSEA